MKNMFVAFLTLLAIFLLKVEPGQSFSCDNAKKQLFPCLNYLIGQGGDAPPSACCNGVHELKESTPTRDDRHAACECLKAAASGVSGIKDDLAVSLFKQCGVGLEFPISKDINCQTIP